MQKISNKEVKDIMYSLGADMCGVASVDRFEEAPQGFHPLDVFPICKKVFSKCGMRCDLCLVYRPNVEKEDRRTEICNAWKKIWKGFEPDPNTTICDGCCCESEGAILFSPLCEVRKCVIGKGFAHCGYCEKYPCSIFPAEPSHEETVQKIEVEKQWTWEDEKLMEAYACKKNMDEFRRIHRI